MKRPPLKFIMRLSAADRDTLTCLMVRTQQESPQGAIARALRIHEAILDLQREEAVLLVRRANGDLCELRFI